MNTKVYKQVKKFIDLYGLPKEIGVTGWISEISEWTYDDKIIGQSNEESKGWIYVQQKSSSLNELDYYNYWDTDSVYAIAVSMCDNRTSDTQLYFTIHDKDFFLDLCNEDADGKGWEWISDVDLEEIVRELNGYTVDPNDEKYNDFNLDTQDFLWSNCEENIVETIYSLPYNACIITWNNGASITLTIKKDNITAKVVNPPTKHHVFVELPSMTYFNDMVTWLQGSKLSYELLCKPDTNHTVGISFENDEHATMFSLKWVR